MNICDMWIIRFQPPCPVMHSLYAVQCTVYTVYKHASVQYSTIPLNMYTMKYIYASSVYTVMCIWTVFVLIFMHMYSQSKEEVKADWLYYTIYMYIYTAYPYQWYIWNKCIPPPHRLCWVKGGGGGCML